MEGEREGEIIRVSENVKLLETTIYYTPYLVVMTVNRRLSGNIFG
jgi:hypothetical protein